MPSHGSPFQYELGSVNAVNQFQQINHVQPVSPDPTPKIDPANLGLI